LNDAGSDLGLAVSLASGFLQASAIWPRSAAGRGVAFVGEVGLAGEIRPAREMSARVSAAEQLDLDSLVVSRHGLQGLGASGAKPTRLKLVGCADVKELVDVFVPSSPSTGVGGRAKAAARGR
jgi:predicted ATP-dependent serine protease